MKRYFLLLFAILPVLVFSQEKTWTLEECIDYAIKNNPVKNKQEATNEMYKINQREAVAGFLPSLRVNSGASFNFGRTLDESQEIPKYIDRTSFGNNYSVSSSLNLFDGFYQIYQLKIAKLDRLRGIDQLEQIENDIAFSIMELYFNVLYYKGAVELAAKQLEESHYNLKRIQRMEELGLKSNPDVTEIQAKKAEDRYRLTQQENYYKLEIIKLKEKMNLDISENIEIEDYNSFPPLFTQEDPLLIYQQALSYLPQALSAEKYLSITQYNYKASQSNLFPSISLNADMGTSFSKVYGNKYVAFEDQLKNHRKASVGFSLSIPIFSRLYNISGVKRSKQRLIIAQLEKEEIFRQIYSDIEKTVADVNGLTVQCVQSAKRRVASEDAHRMNQKKYEEGLISALEVSASANRLLNAQVEELYNQLQYQIKYKLLQYYKGVPVY